MPDESVLLVAAPAGDPIPDGTILYYQIECAGQMLPDKGLILRGGKDDYYEVGPAADIDGAYARRLVNKGILADKRPAHYIDPDAIESAQDSAEVVDTQPAAAPVAVPRPPQPIGAAPSAPSQNTPVGAPPPSRTSLPQSSEQANSAPASDVKAPDAGGEVKAV